MDSLIRDKLFTLPRAVLRYNYEFVCANGNHWIQDFNFVERDIYKHYRAKELKVDAKIKIPNEGDPMTFRYNAAEHS